MQQVHLFCFLASYFTALLFELSRLWNSHSWLRRLSLVATSAGLIAQSWYLIYRSTETNLPPLLSSSHDWLLVSAWLLVVSYLAYVLINFQRSNLESLGLFVLPMAVVMILISSLLNSNAEAYLSSQNMLKMIHSGSLSLGITSVLIGFLISMMYLLQHRRLKKKQHVRSGFSLPPLASLARYNQWTVIVSMLMLTVGMFSGFALIMQSREATRPIPWSDPVPIVFTLVWVGMMLLFGWLTLSGKVPLQGRRLALMNAWAFGFLIITLLGLQLLVSLTGIPSQHG